MDEIIKDVLSEEFDRLNRNIDAYSKMLDKYPKGALVRKKRKNHYVYYLVYREDSKVKSDYVKKNDVDAVQQKIAKRNILCEQIAALKRQRKELKKILRIKD